MKISKDKIELLMIERGLTTKSLSERMAVSRQNFSTIKNRGTCNPATAVKIAAALECDVKDFVIVEEARA